MLDKIDEKNKEFRDAVHGYISIPQVICEKFINTDIFQRLRHIEQTSMRVLYPSAHHDRFSHSLGVFYLGELAFNKIYSNTNELTKSISEDDWKNYRITFLIACLMHDCGHAPFSHTFEGYYKKNNSSDELLNIHKANDPDFAFDFVDVTPAPHEIASSIILYTLFKNEIEELGGDPLLASRMIIGCKYGKTETEKKKFENCLIMLLNGLAIDVDKLDYIVRDTWASGVNNVSIDISRLLSALKIIHDSGKYKLIFKKNALSVLQNVINGRNFLYKWIYSHHKVIYDQYLLKESINNLSSLLSPSNDFMEKLISTKTLKEKNKVCGLDFYLPTDGDLLYYLKIHKDKIPTAKEWLSRKHKNKAIWKTHAEFNEYFPQASNNDLGKLYRKLYKEQFEPDQNRSIKDEYIILNVNPSNLIVEKNELLIEILENVYKSYTEIFDEENKHREPDILVNIDGKDVVLKYFYIYIPDINKKNDVIKLIQKL